MMKFYLICMLVLTTEFMEIVQSKLSIQNLFNKKSGSQESCERSCIKMTTLNITLAYVVKQSPVLFITTVPKTKQSTYIDNMCYSYFDIGFEKTLTVQSIVNTDGTSKQFMFIEEESAGQAGIVKGGGASCSYQDHGPEFGCEGNLLVYRCYKCGTCTDLDLPMVQGSVSLFTIGPSPTVSPECQQELAYKLQKMAGSKDAQFLPLPYKLPTQCVQSVKGLRALGYGQAKGFGLGFIDI